MNQTPSPLTDTFGRHHNYLRISLTERCNLRCSYCMPVDGVKLSPASHLMNAEEIYSIAKTFVKFGVDKIRLTGGEPLVRKDFPQILELLSTLNVELSITSNAVSIDRHIDLLKKSGVKTINISLDTLSAERFHTITFRDYFDRVYQNILKLIDEGFLVKINAVLMRGINDDEILDFIAFTKTHPIVFRFIEFMPFSVSRCQYGSELKIFVLATQNLVIPQIFQSNTLACTHSIQQLCVFGVFRSMLFGQIN